MSLVANDGLCGSGEDEGLLEVCNLQSKAYYSDPNINLVANGCHSQVWLVLIRDAMSITVEV